MEETVEDLRKKVDALTGELAAAKATLDDQLDTSATFQQRNGELESQVLQNKKALLQTNRAVQQLQEALAGKDKEIALLKARQPDKPDLMGSMSAQPLTLPSELPPQAVEAPAKKAA